MDKSGRIVAVMGATGRQGGSVARHLLADGWSVRAITRKPSSAAAVRLRELGAEVVRADMAQEGSLTAAFSGVYGVFSVQNPMTSGIEGEIRQGKNVANAAKAAGVEHVVYGSAGVGRSDTGVGSWDSKLAIEAHMRDLGLPVTVLRPVAFMELMSDKGFYPAVAMWHLMPKLTGADLPIGWISVEDVGAAAARAFGEPDRFVGAELRLAADVRSNVECRRLWAQIQGWPPKSFPMPVWLFHRFVGTDLTTMWRWLSTAGLDFDVAQTRELLPSALTVRDWLQRLKAHRDRSRARR